MAVPEAIRDVTGAPRIVVRIAGLVVQEIELRDEVYIGRSGTNAVSLVDPSVALRHAQVTREGERYVVQSSSEENELLLNGVSLEGSHPLESGDCITVGEAELTFLEAGETSREQRSGPAASAGQPSGEATSDGASSRRPAYRVSVGGILLLLAIAAAIIYLLLSGKIPVLFQGATPSPTTTREAAHPSPSPLPSGTAVRATPETGTPAPMEPDEELERAAALMLRSDFEEAIAIHMDLSRGEPADARPEVGWAWTLIYDEQPEPALTHAYAALEREPRNVDALTVLARAYLGVGDVGQALGMAQSAVRTLGSGAEANTVLAEVYRASGLTKEAVQQAELALDRDPNNADAHRVRGLLYLEGGNVASAVVELQAAVDLQPELWIRHHELGSALLQGQEYDAAIVALKNALALRRKAVTYTALGVSYYSLGQPDRARAYLEQALSAGATGVHTFALLSVIHAEQGRCDDSWIYAELALKQDPEDVRALGAKGMCQQEGVVETRPAPTLTPEAPAPGPTLPPLAGRVAFPVWNPESGRYDTYLSNPDGSGRQRVISEMHQPALNPDGNWLAVNGEQHHQQNLSLLRPDGSDQREITQHAEDGQPRWSPDGKALVFSSTQHGDRQSRIYVIDQIPAGGEKVPGRTLIAGPHEALGESASWMPDGRVVYRGCNYAAMPAECGLLLLSAEPGSQIPERLTAHWGDTAPAAHSDRVAFMSDRDGNWEIYVVGADGSGLQRLTFRAANDGLPAWSPDGSTLAFVSDQDGVWALWAMNPDGSNVRKLFDVGGGGLGADWQHEAISWGP